MMATSTAYQNELQWSNKPLMHNIQGRGYVEATGSNCSVLNEKEVFSELETGNREPEVESITLS